MHCKLTEIDRMAASLQIAILNHHVDRIVRYNGFHWKFKNFLSWAIAEGLRDASWQLKRCEMSHKCSSNCVWKDMQQANDLQGHPRWLKWHESIGYVILSISVCGNNVSILIQKYYHFYSIRDCLTFKSLSFKKRLRLKAADAFEFMYTPQRRMNGS